MAIGTFNIITDPNFPPAIITTSALNTSNNSSITILNPELSLFKSQSMDYAAIGDKVNYTIVAKNNNDISANNLLLTQVKIKDLLASELKFIEGSLKINGIVNKEANIVDGVVIGDLQAGESKTITFDVEIITASLTSVTNKATAQFNFKLEQNGPIQIGTSSSNILNLIVKKPNILVTKETDKPSASLNDILTYTVKLINDGDLDASNVLFTDNMSSIVSLIDGSFKINKKVVNSVELNKGVAIGPIKIDEVINIEYKVIVNGTDCAGRVENTAKVAFNYEFLDKTTGYRERESNKIAVNINITSFKQISIDNYLRLPDQKPDLGEINNVTGSVEVLSCHTINNTKSKSLEGQGSSGYKIVVHGVLKEIVEYTSNDLGESIHAAHYEEPFSTFIVLPSSYKGGSKIEVTGIIENVYHNVIDTRNFFKNNTILLTAKILIPN